MFNIFVAVLSLVYSCVWLFRYADATNETDSRFFLTMNVLYLILTYVIMK
jgi:hypothetical protein